MKVRPEALSDNADFYPTPPALASKMLALVKGNPLRILEPSAGKGDLIEAFKEVRYDRWGQRFEVFAIERDPTLQATLRGKGVKLLDTDFLGFAGPDKFDLILMNPPFSEGDKHLLKAIDILYRGQIVCLLNAETIRNPHTNSRKLLVRKLDELGAKIEYVKNAFAVAERKAKVEVALVSIVVDRKVEDDLFADCDDHAGRSREKVKSKNEVSTGRNVGEMVADFNETIRIGTEVILTYFRHHKRVGPYLGLNCEAKKYTHSDETLTGMLQAKLNDFVRDVRVDYWRRTLELKEVRSRLTARKREEFEQALTDRANMDFTEANIRQFVLNLIGTYEQTLTEAVLDLFDRLTVRHSWTGKPDEKNIHYFNGWKTNKAFKVGKRVVVPIHGSYAGPFYDSTFGKWRLNYAARDTLDDFDKVMNYFDGARYYLGIGTAIEAAFNCGKTSGESHYFKFVCHKKGTIHLTFLDDDVLRRFNLVACRGKRWLPEDYGTKAYKDMPKEEQTVADAFEGKESYQKNARKPLFASNRLMLKAA